MYVYKHVCVCKQNKNKNKITKTALHDIQANYRVPFNTGTAPICHFCYPFQAIQLRYSGNDKQLRHISAKAFLQCNSSVLD